MRIIFPQYDYEYMDAEVKSGEWVLTSELFPSIPFESARQVDKLVLRKDEDGFYKEVWLL